MGEMMKCPLCGGNHPMGTTFCDVMWGEIPQTIKTDAVKEDLLNCNQEDNLENAGEGRCPSCGSIGVVGDECWQCGGTIERMPCEKKRGKVVIRLDGGPSVALDLEKTIIIGRESDSREISDMLMKYDVVSRRHCSVRLSSDATMVTVADCGSTNGTFIGPNAERLDRSMTCTAKLPVRIRLGSSIGLTLELEE